jgi:hypothetical protein
MGEGGRQAATSPTKFIEQINYQEIDEGEVSVLVIGQLASWKNSVKNVTIYNLFSL